METEVGHVTSSGGHTSPDDALSLVPLPTFFGASLAPATSDWYSLGALRAGSALTVRPVMPTSGNPIGTWLTLHPASDLGEVAPANFIVSTSIPADGEYLLRVSGLSPVTTGDYLLFADGRGCAQPGPRSTDGLYINEIFARPGQSGGDANGDGVSSPGDDPFVEVVSPAQRALDLSGLELRDAAGARYRAACGDSVVPGGAITVFAACRDLLVHGERAVGIFR